HREHRGCTEGTEILCALCELCALCVTNDPAPDSITSAQTHAYKMTGRIGHDREEFAGTVCTADDLLRLRAGEPEGLTNTQLCARRCGGRRMATGDLSRSVPRRLERRHHRHAARLSFKLDGHLSLDATQRSRCPALHRHSRLRDQTP